MRFLSAGRAQRRHIGNNYVNIVFSANAETFDHAQLVGALSAPPAVARRTSRALARATGQHNLVTIVVYPKRLGLYKSTLLCVQAHRH